ncbi:MAG: class C sortase [Clostridiales bacterium]|nr:class C sortase [Clostridiales bacterium]
MKKGRACIVLIILLLIAGVAVLFYPLIADKWDAHREKLLLGDYTDGIASEVEEGRDFTVEWERAYAYNDALTASNLPDPFAVAAAQDEPNPEYMACLDPDGDGVMGYVSIPKIDIYLPIYHTTGDEVLQLGAGHLEGSSLPVGGEGTHAVIAAHRGLPSQRLFTDLDELAEGDHFLIYVLDDVLCYEVDQIRVVEPTDTSDLVIEEGEDLVTLLTCTPYGENTQRLLVRGHRVPYDESVQNEGKDLSDLVSGIAYWKWVLSGAIAAVIIIVILHRIMGKRGHRHGKKPGR